REPTPRTSGPSCGIAATSARAARTTVKAASSTRPIPKRAAREMKAARRPSGAASTRDRATRKTHRAMATGPGTARAPRPVRAAMRGSTSRGSTPGVKRRPSGKGRNRAEPGTRLACRRLLLHGPRLRAQRGYSCPRVGDSRLELGIGIAPEIKKASVVAERLLPVAFLLMELPEAQQRHRYEHGVLGSRVGRRRQVRPLVEGERRVRLAGAVPGHAGEEPAAWIAVRGLLHAGEGDRCVPPAALGHGHESIPVGGICRMPGSP